MAGVMMTGDEGMDAGVQAVPPIGGADYRAKNGLPTTVNVAKSAHFNENRAEGVHYNSDASIGETLTTRAYPAGTDNGEASNPLR